jgi:hypothetical protein
MNFMELLVFTARACHGIDHALKGKSPQELKELYTSTCFSKLFGGVTSYIAK